MKKIVFLSLLIFSFACYYFFGINKTSKPNYFQGKLSLEIDKESRSISSKENVKECNFSFDDDFLNEEFEKYQDMNTSLFDKFVDSISVFSMELKPDEVYSCDNITCLYEKVYKKAGFSTEDSKITAKKIFLHYLKTSSIIAATSNHNWVEVNSKLSDTVFNPSEIDSFWRLSYLYNTKYMILPSVHTIYRSQKNHKHPNYETACAVTMDGYIVYFDCGLGNQTKYPSNLIEDKMNLSYLNVTTVHERSHHIPFLAEFSDIKFNGLNWNQSAGWEKIETFYDGKYKVENLNERSFLRPYAKVNEDEDFAVNTEYFVFQPYILKTKIPILFEFMKEKFFNGMDYTKEGLIEQYIKYLQTNILNELQVSCDKGSTSMFPDCLLEQIHSKIDYYTLKFGNLYPEYCNLTKKDKNIKDEAFDNISEIIKNTFEQETVYQSFIKSFNNEYDLSSIAMYNFANNNTEKEFMDNLQSIFLAEYLKNNTEDNSKKAWARFGKSLDYNLLLQKTKDHYNIKIFPPSEIKKFTNDLWNDCRIEKSNYIENYLPFEGDRAYIKVQQLFCINNNIYPKLKIYYNDKWDTLAHNRNDNERKDVILEFLTKVNIKEILQILSSIELKQYEYEKTYLDKLSIELKTLSISKKRERIELEKEKNDFLFFAISEEYFFDENHFYSLLKRKLMIEASRAFSCYEPVIKLKLFNVYGDVITDLKKSLDLKSLDKKYIRNDFKVKIINEVANDSLANNCKIKLKKDEVVTSF